MSTDIENVTEDEAIDTIHALRARFDWSGTEFMHSDVEEMVREQLISHLLVPTDEQIAELVEQITGGYAYRKLADRFAELGNQILLDAVIDATGTEDE